MNKKLKQPKLFSSRQTAGCNNFVTYLLRSFLLLAIMVMGASNVWSDDVISTFTMPTENPSAAFDDGTKGSDGYILGTKDRVTYFAQGLKDDDRKHVSRVVDGITYRKLQDNDIEKAHIKLQFTAGTVKAGDEISITCVHVYGENDQDIGYEMGVSGTNVMGKSASSPLTLTHTLIASEIVDNGDGNEYIRIGRLDWNQSAYGTITITRPSTTTFTVTWDNSDIPSGCDAWFTVGSDATEYRATKTDIPDGASVTFHGSDSGADHKMINGWDNPNGSYWGWGATKTITVTSDISVKPDFQNCFRVFANAENGATANVNKTGKFFQKVEGLSFSTTVPSGYTFDGWYNGSSRLSGDNPYSYGTYQPGNGTDDLTLTAKFIPDTYTPSCDWGGAGYTQVLSPTSANAGIAPFSVKVGGVTVPKSDYTLSYTVKSGPISVTADGKITVNSEDASVKALTDGYSTPVDAYITVTATPNSGSFSAGSVDLKVQIKAVTNGTVKLNPSEVRIGDYFDVTIERGTGFPNIKYYWSFPENTTNIYGYTGTPLVQDETSKDGVAIPYQFLATGATSGKMDIYARIESPNTATEYKGLYGSGITIKPITIPTIVQDGSDVIVTYETDFVNRKGEDVDAFLEYWIGEKIDANRKQTGFGNNTSSITLNDLPVGSVITAKSVVRFKKPDNPEEFAYASSNEVTYTVKKPFETVNVNGTEREYYIYVPEGITSGGKVGVVLSLHNGGEDVSEGTSGRVYFNDIADANKTDDAKKFVVVSPRALVRDGARNWQLDESSTDDTEFFKAIVKKINDDANGLTVDYDRIYLAGYGTGGAMAFKVAHKDADFYAAIASVSGVPYDNSHLWHAGKKPVPFLFIQGANDGVFRDQIGNDNVTVIAHNMMYRNGAAFSASNGTLNIKGTNNDITYDCHEAETGGAAFYHYTIPGMYHQSDFDWDGTTGDDVAPTAWAFFNKNDKVKSVDETLKFRVDDPDYFWNNASNYGFVKGAADSKDVLSYGGTTKTNDNKNIYHSLQFNGGINGANHYLKLDVETTNVGGATNEVASDYFLVTLTKTGESTPVFAKRYQAGRGRKDLYINFSALPGLNEYKLTVTKSRADLTVNVHAVEFHTGRCDDLKDGAGKPLHTENPTFFFDVESTLETAGMKPIYQPIYGKSYDGLAKEYLPIADIPVGGSPKTVEDALKKDDTAIENIPSTLILSWTDGKATLSSTGLFNLAHSGKDGEITDVKENNAYIYVPDELSYPVDKVKGINISANGRAKMPEYLNGTVGDFPDRGVIAIKVEGTVDFTLLAQNDINYPGDDANVGRSTLKVYYTNDQMNNELKELKEWWFFGTRHEGYVDDGKTYADHPNGNSMSPLSVNVRLPQLGKDGTCTLFITYEGRRNNDCTFTHPDGTPGVYDGADDADKIWIKGFVIKRPDLKVTIGRTDSKYSGQKYNGEDNTKRTRFGENKPYIWSFDNVGFNNTKYDDLTEKKINVKDGRTYVCDGTGDNEGMDHLLLYSDPTVITDAEGKVTNLEDKVQFDGRVRGQEHIEFRKKSVYNIPDDNLKARAVFDPIQSNGLKVNVTGSGWFKIKCAAPNGPVKMKVYSSTNYGAAYINLLREFDVEQSSSETDWHEYTVYLKGHVNRIADKEKAAADRRPQEGFWDGDYANAYDEGAEEIIRMSLFVVFDEVEGTTYDEGHPQFNIHELSWLNEEPADYVFQREEDPELLTTWQAIRRDNNGKITTDKAYAPILWWKAGNDDDDAYPMLKENDKATYNRLGQYTTSIANQGVKSPGGYASTSVPSDAGSYDAYWDIAAPASTNSHTEAAYAQGNTEITSSSPQYVYNGANEFSVPVSGSFIRICAMKNTYVVAHVIPEKTTGENGIIYVLDETGAHIPFSSGATDAKRRGYIAAFDNVSGESYGYKTTENNTIRIDFTANAGKEYFICCKDSKLSLARLEVHNWRYNPTKASDKLELADGATDNASKIATAYNNGTSYMDANLKRKVSNNWISLVLPFSMNEKKFEEVFGKGAKCIHFTDVDIPGKKVKLTHHYYNMIVAGRPVFVKPNNPNVDVEGYLEDITDVTLEAKTVKNYESVGDFQFIGSYDNTEMKRNDLFMNNANAIKYLTDESASYPGMRSFIKNNGGPDFYNIIGTSSSSTGAKAMFLNFCDLDEDTATGIEELISAEFGENAVVVKKSTKAYDLNGRVVAEGADINSLPAGIYVVNGKKYAVVK